MTCPLPSWFVHRTTQALPRALSRLLLEEHRASRNDDIVRCANGHRPAALFRHLPRVREGCERHLLYGNSLGSLELCTGGTLSLVVGGLTLRLPVDALLTLHDLVHGALTALEEAERHAAQRPWTEEN